MNAFSRRLIPFCRVAASLALLLVFAGSSRAQTQAGSKPLKTRYVVLIVADGLRWQEVFTGADKDLLLTESGGSWAKPEELKRLYWRDSPEDRRAALFPFLWSTIAKQGLLYGNQNKGSVAKVTNGLAFSYPGYNEILTGVPDPKIDSNEFGPNPNVTVFEWLNNQPDFHDKVAVYGTWETFKDIFNVKRSRIPMQVGWDAPYSGAGLAPREQLLNQLYRTTTKMDDEDNYDSFIQVPLVDALQKQQPRLLFVGYGETDNWAHSGRYDLVLESAHGVDQFVKQLWELVQSRPETRDQTTFILTTDHGRGGGLVEWKEHGVDEKGSENIWIAAIGPDTAALGELTNHAGVTQSQIAATVAALLGKDYRSAVPKAGAPLPEILGKK